MWGEGEFVVVHGVIANMLTAVVVCARATENGWLIIQTDAGLCTLPTPSK